MENDFSGGGLQPVRDAPGAAAPFLPVTRRDRLLCVLLVSVIVVCGYHAACGVPALVKAMGSSAAESEDVPLETEPLEVSPMPSDDAESATLDVEEVPIVRGDDGRKYYDLSTVLASSDDVSKAGGRQGAFASGESDEKFGTAVFLYRADVSTDDGLLCFPQSGYLYERENLQSGFDGSAALHASLFNGSGYGETSIRVITPGIGYTQESADAGITQYDSLGALYADGYCLHSENGSTLYLAAGGNPAIRIAQWAHSKFWTSAVGRKLAQSGCAALLSLCVQCGAMTIMDETLAKEAPMLSEATTVVMTRALPEIQVIAEAAISDGVIAQEELAMVALETGMQNAARGVAVTESEFIAQTAENYIAMYNGASGAYVTDAFMAKLAEGLVACEDIPLIAQFGQMLCEFAGYELSAYPDAEGFLTTEGGKFGEYVDVAGSLYVQGTYPAGHPRAGQPSDAMRHNLNLQNGRYVTDWYLWQDTGVITYQSGWTNYSMNCDCVYVQGKVYSPADGAYSWTTRFYAPVPVVNLEMPNAATHYLGAVSNPTTSQLESAESDLVDLTRQGVSNFFESGGQLVGNDAQYGDGGEIIDSGHANILDSVYGDGDYSTWADALSAGELQAVKPSGESEANASDEVVEGSGKGSTVGESTGKSNPPTAPQLMYSIDANMGDLQDAVSDKFPFSIPFNVSRTVDMLIASPEAPHFTWVFALPTGNVEYEVDLSPFSPVAHVLRVMLDVLMVFVVISLLGKIAQVWGFFDKAAD